MPKRRFDTFDEYFSAEGECVVYTGARDRDGYGIHGTGPGEHRTHRLVWIANYGPIDPGVCILHRCDNPPCGRVDHLFAGTIADNNADKAAKGRSGAPCGEENGIAKMAGHDVAAIVARYVAGEKQREIAATLGVSQGTISRILRAKGWKHIGLKDQGDMRRNRWRY